MASADRDVLEVLFRSTGGDKWESKDNWATDADLSTWHGITADKDGRVTALHLSSNFLQGPIPEALGALVHLVELDLSNNQLTGPIPEAVAVLTNLRGVNLSNNQLTGTVPLSFWKHLLRSYDVSGNLLTHFTDPQEKNASTRVVLDNMRRAKRFKTEYRGGLNTTGNPWEFPPAAVVANGLESIRRYYDTWEQCDFRLVEIHALKIVFVGAYGAGKTSLARSIKMGRGDRTPEVDENRRTTVGVDLHSHELRDGTECKIYDVAGQITYYGLHQFFLTERGVYLIVFDATKFEGMSGKKLDEAVEDNILDWVSLLHMRTPLCNVMLVASHFDMLRGATQQENKQLLVTVENRFLQLHARWKSLRHSQHVDTRMSILPGIFSVGCKLASESASCTGEDGLQAIDEALSSQTTVGSFVPPSWVAARQVLEEMGSTHDGGFGDKATVGGRRRPWELRSAIHAKFESFAAEGRRNASQGGGQQHQASLLSGLQEDGLRNSMNGAIEMRAFSGTVISHDVFVVMDVMWLAGVLKPILDHRGIIKNEVGDKVFADRELNTAVLLTWADDLVDQGILREGFARFLWSLKQQITEGADDPHEMEPAKFEEILEELGVTIPLPEARSNTAVDQSFESSPPAGVESKSSEGGNGIPSGDGVDLLVVMRLPLKADAEMRNTLSLARRAALNSRRGSGGRSSLKAVFEFDHAGAPHGLPERVMALSHKIGIFSPRARWRLGGLFLLHNDVSGDSSMILEYDKKGKTFCIEALGQATSEIRAVQFVISALFYVARDFPGASWTAWMECGLRHDGEKMYHLATSHETQHQTPGSRIVPLTYNSTSGRGTKMRNLCGMQGLDARGSCTLDSEAFGKVLNIKQPFEVSGEAQASFGGLKDRNKAPNASTTSQRLVQEVGELTKTVARVEGAVGRVEACIQKLDEDMQVMARGMQESLVRLKRLQAPNYRYPHLMEVKKAQADGERSLRSRLRGVFVTDMRLHFLCSFDMSKVPCGVGGDGYRLQNTRGWVKKVSPALQVTVVMARVALKAVTGVELQALSDFVQDVGNGLVEELVDRSLDEDALLGVLCGDEDAAAEMQRDTRASYEAIKAFMEKEEAKRRKEARDGDGYRDFRDSMKEVDDGKGGLVWVKTENVQKWRESMPTAAPST